MGCGYLVKPRMRTDLLPAAWAAMDGTLFFSDRGPISGGLKARENAIHGEL
jgi:hypothetical protein